MTTMTTSEQINELAKACAFAQAALKPALKDATNPAFKSKYADLAAVVEAAKVYAAQGVAVWQDATTDDAGVSVRTRLVHVSGQWVEFGPYTVPLGKRDAHGVGSATTYAKRFALSAALLISADEDDDGNAAAQATPKPSLVEPEGYRAWLDDLTGVADEGSAALQSAWVSSPATLRKHLTETAPATWATIKARAGKVTV